MRSRMTRWLKSLAKVSVLLRTGTGLICIGLWPNIQLHMYPVHYLT